MSQALERAIDDRQASQLLSLLRDQPNHIKPLSHAPGGHVFSPPSPRTDMLTSVETPLMALHRSSSAGQICVRTGALLYQKRKVETAIIQSGKTSC